MCSSIKINVFPCYFSDDMEFASLIKTPRVEKVVIHRPFHKATEGALCITGHHLIFSAGGENPDELWVVSVCCCLLLVQLIKLTLIVNTAPASDYRFGREETKPSSSFWRLCIHQVQRL
jgi:hypothetical protein